jgi:hypothetical protein
MTFDQLWQLGKELVQRIAPLAAIAAAFFSWYTARSSTRREWARSRLADAYVEIIRAAHVAEEILSNWEGEEGSADEQDPDNAPHYAWTEEDQKRLDWAQIQIAQKVAELEMFSPAYVVTAVQALQSSVWLAESYHRLAHELEIMETSPAGNRHARIAKDRHNFVDAVRIDLGVATAPTLRRWFAYAVRWPRWRYVAWQSRKRQRQARELAERGDEGGDSGPG